MILDIRMVCGDSSALVVKAPTKVSYQYGDYKYAAHEGFCLNFAQVGKKFDATKYSCDLPKAINSYLAKVSEASDYNLQFDFSRASELSAGCWPVIITGNLCDHNGRPYHENIDWCGWLCTNEERQSEDKSE